MSNELLRTRIGNTVTVVLPVLTRGDAVSLVGRDITIMLVDPNDTKTPVSFTIGGVDNNIATFVVEGTSQSATGTYRAEVYENYRGTAMAVYDCDIFVLVARTEYENDGNEGVSSETTTLDPINIAWVGRDGYTPYIQDGYWYINGTSTNVKAAGENGDTPYIENGYWYIGGISTGIKVDYTNEEAERSAAEQVRVVAEAARVQAEAARTLAENSRLTEESGRSQAEGVRILAERDRQAAETTRQTQEEIRHDNEEARVEAELGRAASETSRAQVEATRVANESARTTAEATRAANEQTRVSEESDRAAAETARIANETARETAEDGRASAEATRVSNEQTRVSNESTRQSNESARQSAETARQAAYVAAENARDAAFEAKEATRDAANEAALNCAESLAALGQKIDKVTSTKVDVSAGTNLINENGLTIGAGILASTTNGNVTQAAYTSDMNVSDYIPVKSDGIISNAFFNTYWGGAVYDSNKAFLRVLSSSQYTYQSGDGYIRLTFRDTDTPMANYGTTLLPFEEFNPIEGYMGGYVKSSAYEADKASTQLALNNKIYDRTSYKKTYTITDSGQYINLNYSVGDTCSKAETSIGNNIGYIVLLCEEGDIFDITTYANTSNYRAYAVLDKDNKVLEVADSSVTSTSSLRITIGQGGTQLVVNSRTNSGTPTIVHYRNNSQIISEDMTKVMKGLDEIVGEIKDVSSDYTTDYSYAIATNQTWATYYHSHLFQVTKGDKYKIVANGDYVNVSFAESGTVPTSGTKPIWANQTRGRTTINSGEYIIVDILEDCDMFVCVGSSGTNGASVYQYIWNTTKFAGLEEEAEEAKNIALQVQSELGNIVDGGTSTNNVSQSASYAPAFMLSYSTSTSEFAVKTSATSTFTIGAYRVKKGCTYNVHIPKTGNEYGIVYMFSSSLLETPTSTAVNYDGYTPQIEMGNSSEKNLTLQCTTEHQYLLIAYNSSGGSPTVVEQTTLNGLLKDEITLTEVISNSRPYVSSSCGTNGASASVATLEDEEYIALTNYPVANHFGEIVAFRADISTFDTIHIGKGGYAQIGSFGEYMNVWLKIDNTNIYLYRNLAGSSPSIADTIPHGLTLSTYIQIYMFGRDDGKMYVNIMTLGQHFAVTLDNWNPNAAGYVTILSEDSELTNCKLTANNRFLKSSFWIFGASYEMEGNFWQLYARKFGCGQYLANGYPGRNSLNSYADFMRALNFGCPKFLYFTAWGNGSAEDLQTYIQKVYDVCTQKGITLIIVNRPNSTASAISTTYTARKAVIDSFIALGVRYVDIAAAVSSNPSSPDGWYSGYLGSDGLHPTSLGGEAIAMQVMLDIPELAQVSNSDEYVDNV